MRTSTTVEMWCYNTEMTVIFYTTAQTWLSSLDAAGRAAVLTAFALPVMYSFFFIIIIIIAHHRAWTYVSSAGNISSHELCCFTSDRVHPVSEQSFPKFEFGSPSVSALHRRKRRKTEKKPKLWGSHFIAALWQLKKIKSPKNHLKTIQRGSVLLFSHAPSALLNRFT